MLSSLYSDILLDAAASLPPVRHLSSPTLTARKTSRVCGSDVKVELQVEDGIIIDFGLEAKACALGQASAGLVAANLIGTRVNELIGLRDEMRAFLKENGPPPSAEKWQDLRTLEAIRDYPQRHASTLLIFEVLASCAEEWIEKNQS